LFFVDLGPSSIGVTLLPQLTLSSSTFSLLVYFVGLLSVPTFGELLAVLLMLFVDFFSYFNPAILTLRP